MPPPAMAAAQSGWMKGLPPSLASQRRTSAPMPALNAISSRLAASSAPKKTPSDAAPMAANSAKRGVEAGGRRSAAASAGRVASLGKVPSQS
jgi:hypothetical protein